MKIYAHSTIFGVKESGIQIVSDFMIPFVLLYNDLKKEIRLNKLSFCVHGQEGEIIQKEIDSSALASRFRSAIEEWKLYRFATWERTLGIPQAFALDDLPNAIF